MARIAEFTVPATEFVLVGALAAAPDARAEAERVVSATGRTPYFRVSGGDVPAFERGLDEDPAVADWEVAERGETGRLYRATWADDPTRVELALDETATSLVRAVGEADTWRLRVLVPDQEALSAFHERCEAREVPFTLTRLFDGAERIDDDRYGLTPDQFEVLAAAMRNDYFGVPRGVKLSELAESLDISTQAASKRLRRGHENLLENTLFAEE